MWDPYAEFQSATLPNGLTVHAAHWPNRPWEAIGFVVHSGGEQDLTSLEGTAHFVEHVVSKSADISRKDISAFFEECGGSVNCGQTIQQATAFSFFVPLDEKLLATAFSLFGQMLISGKLEKFIERERQVIIQEIHRKYPFKFNLDLDVKERQVLYKGYWLEKHPTLMGNPESVSRITQSDIQEYYNSHYTPANISVVGVGGLDIQGLTKLLSESPFALKKPGTRTPLPSYVDSIGPPTENRCIFDCSKHIYLATPMEIGTYRSVAVIPGNVGIAIKILKAMLDELLDDEIRQSRAWTYHISSADYNFRHFHEFSINCGSLAVAALDDIEKVVNECICSLAEKKDLFEQEKRRAIARNRMTDPRGRSIRDGATDDLVNNYRIISITEHGEELEKLQMTDILNLLPWIRPERRWTLIRKP